MFSNISWSIDFEFDTGMLSAVLVADLSSEAPLNIASSSSAGMSFFPSATQVSYRFFNIELNPELGYCVGLRGIMPHLKNQEKYLIEPSAHRLTSD